MRRPFVLSAALTWTLLLVSNPAAAAPHIYTIVIDKMRFGPVPQQLHKGDTIVWDNHDMFQHSATDKGVFDLDIGAGKKAALRLTRAGTFPFVCKYHPGMKGVLKVAP